MILRRNAQISDAKAIAKVHVFSNQQARQFYKSLGFIESSATKVDKRDNYILREVRYRKKLK